MLLSQLLALTPTRPVTPRGFYGRQARAWFLGQVQRHDRALAEALHGGDGARCYTVSTLWHPPGLLRPGDACYLRLTSLAEPLTRLLTGPFLERLPQRAQIGDLELQPLGRAAWHAWDGQTTFDALVEAAHQRQQPRVTLHFAAPTAFRAQGSDQTLPAPYLVWGSLYRSWQQFAPPALRIHELWPRFVSAGVVVSDFHLQSEKVIFKQGTKGAATGCTGYATYRLLPAHLCGDYGDVREGAEAVLHTLSAFAQFCGVGHHTAIGLGQARAIQDLQEIEGGVMTPRYRQVKMG